VGKTHGHPRRTVAKLRKRWGTKQWWVLQAGEAKEKGKILKRGEFKKNNSMPTQILEPLSKKGLKRGKVVVPRKKKDDLKGDG